MPAHKPDNCYNPACDKELSHSKIKKLFKKDNPEEISDIEGNTFCSKSCILDFYLNRLKNNLINKQSRRVKRKLGMVLIEQNKIAPHQIKAALIRQKKSKKRFGETLLEMGFIDEKDLTIALSIQSGIPWISKEHLHINTSAMKLLPKELCLLSRIVPFEYTAHDNKISVLIDEPGEYFTADTIYRITGMGIKQFITEQSFFIEIFERYIGAYDKPEPFKTDEDDEETVAFEKTIKNLDEVLEYCNTFGSLSAEIYKRLESFLIFYKDCNIHLSFFHSGNFQISIEDYDVEIMISVCIKDTMEDKY